MRKKTWMQTLVALAISASALALSAGSAAAYTVSSGWIAEDYVTGFSGSPGPEDAGPIGLAFDSSANLLVTDITNGTFHRVPPGGGTAAGTLVATGLGKPAGLAFGADGRLYMARADQARVDEIDPANASVIRTVVSGNKVLCPTGLATDPLSGDLFASNKCGGGNIARISNPAGSSASASTYTNGESDGLTFAPDGTLFAAADDSRVDSISGTNSSSPGQRTTIANVDEIDGIAYSPAQPGQDAYLVVNRNNGEIDKLDFAGNLTPIVTGASRGDLVTVGPDHCIYADLQDRIIKVSPASGSCTFSTPVQPTGTSGGGSGGGSGGVLGTKAERRVVDTAIKARATKSVRRGSRFTVKLRVSNKSRTTAHKVVVTNKLPKGTKFVSARSVHGVSCRHTRKSVTCRLSKLRGRHGFTIKLVLRAVHRSRYTDTARVKSSDLDPAPGNNKSRARTKVRSGSHVLGVQRRGGRLPRTTG